MREKLLSILFIFLFFFTGITAFSQVSGPDPDCDPQIDPTCEKRAPITESIILLLAGGFGLGIRAVSKKRKKH